MTPLLLSLAAGGTSAAAQGTSKTLVACFSRSGNTRVVAGQVRRALGADLFEIEPDIPYPDDYFATVAQAQQERDRGYEPLLKTTADTIARYSTVFLGFPIWGMTAPPVIRSFLSTHDLSGKTIVPLVTHGGYGLGDSMRVVAGHAPQANVLDAFSTQAPQERETIERVSAWLDQQQIQK
ncbi:flavodoxin [Shinella sp. CPCC 101442]|uniref:flavodoxin n=1 Tax=Shinella sp. CPCC 101442 TaxID=2932265 RepID=UPI002152D1D5|nr:flavodoxin [Shinella sp. CPCC 101442]MCR6499828.1 flavodoxin [Shinella sp. CPCC 101442]